MVTATLFLSGIDMSEDEYLETLSHAKRFEFTNGVVTAKRGPYMTPKSHVAIAEEVSAAFREYRRAQGGFGGQTPTTNLSQGTDRVCIAIHAQRVKRVRRPTRPTSRRSTRHP